MHEHEQAKHPEWQHNLSAYRLDSIHQALSSCADDETLATAAFAIYSEAREQVTFYDDALPALERLSLHYLLIALKMATPIWLSPQQTRTSAFQAMAKINDHRCQRITR